MKLYSSSLKNFLNKWPGKKTFGLYRFLPIFFVLGAALEFSMINWRVGEVNFCKLPPQIFTHLSINILVDSTYKRRQAKTIIEQKLLDETTV